MEGCNINNRHCYCTVTTTWQTVEYYQVLNHSRQIVVCQFCGEVKDPFSQIQSVQTVPDVKPSSNVERRKP
jgi:hypothetical protein